MGKAVLAAWVLLLLAGCATQSAVAPAISDAWLAGIPVEQQAGIAQARSSHKAAADQEASARVMIDDARREISTAESAKRKASARFDSTRGKVELAQARGDAAGIISANRDREAAQAEVDLAQARVDAAQARLGAAERRLDLAKAQTKLADAQATEQKYRTLAARHDTRVADMKPETFATEVTNRQAEVDRAQAASQSAEEAQAEKEKALGEAQSRLEAARQATQG